MGRIISEAILSRNTQKLSKRKRQMPYGCTKKRDYNIGSNIPIPPTCPESTSYTISNVSYYTTVASDAVNNTISFSYVETIVKTDCTSKYRRGNDSIDVLFDANDTHNSKIIKGTVQYYNIEISYSFIQEGIPCEEKTNYIVSNVDYSRAIDAETTANTLTIDYIKTTINKDCQTTTINGSEKIIVECGENISYDQRTISGRITWNNNDIEYSFIQKGVMCDASTSYTISNVSYPQSVEYNATNAVISFSYIKTIINSDCSVVNNPGTDSIEIEFDTNTTHNPKTITGEVRYQGVEIRYSFTQKGAPCEERVSYSITNVTYNDYVNCDATANTIHFNYVETHTNTNCETSVNSVAKTVDVVFDENTTSEEITFSGTITYNGLPISYSFVQKKGICKESITYEIESVSYKNTVNSWSTSNDVTVAYSGIVTLPSCRTFPHSGDEIVDVEFDANWSIIPKTINGFIDFHGSQITYSFVQEEYKKEDWIIATYRGIGSITLFKNSSNFNAMIVDGEEKNINNRFIFDKEGDHIVQYHLKDNTFIGRETFRWNTSLISVDLPNNITKIEALAFDSCPNLRIVNLPGNVSTIEDCAFSNCFGLLTLEIPQSVNSIKNYAFQCCSGLTAINISKNVTKIGQHTFSFCSSIYEITVDESNTVYDSRNNCNAIIEKNTNTLMWGCKNTIIPNSIKIIGEESFALCKIENITIPNGVEIIDDRAFNSCVYLKSVKIPNSVTDIGWCAFQGCNTLEEITLPNGVTKIDGYCFDGCSSLSRIIIPNSMQTIGDGAFRSCPNLDYIILEGHPGRIEYGNKVFGETTGCPIYIEGCFADDGLFPMGYKERTKAATIVVTYGIEQIGSVHITKNDYIVFNTLYSAKVDGVKLKTLSTSHYFETIGEHRIEYTLVSPSKILQDVFYGCNRIKSINIPQSITYIGDNVFYGCDNLITIMCYPTIPPIIGDNIIDNNINCIIYVPSGSLEKYKEAEGWSAYAGKIQAMP